MFSHAGAWRERVLAAEMNMQGLWCSQWCPRVCGAMAEWGKHFGNTSACSMSSFKRRYVSFHYRDTLLYSVVLHL